MQRTLTSANNQAPRVLAGAAAAAAAVDAAPDIDVSQVKALRAIVQGVVDWDSRQELRSADPTRAARATAAIASVATPPRAALLVLRLLVLGCCCSSPSSFSSSSSTTTSYCSFSLSALLCHLPSSSIDPAARRPPAHPWGMCADLNCRLPAAQNVKPEQRQQPHHTAPSPDAEAADVGGIVGGLAGSPDDADFQPAG